ncbi:MAG: hypothetical protein M1820_003211 [Bogoriella megaspora]|nr:MAG: hypothetical protein M1820_003211 [Bogoriella megaspora]
MSKKSGKDDASSKTTPPIVSLVAGGVAGGIEAAATYPFEFAKTRAQLRQEHGQPIPRNPFLVVFRTWRGEGIQALYKGCTSLIIGSIGKDAVRFLSFDTIKHAFADSETGTLTPLRNLLAGMTAGIVASFTAVTPTERIKTALIDDARTARRFHGPIHAIAVIWKEHGLAGIYRGWEGTTLKQAGATAFRMGTYNILKDYERRHDIPQSGAATNFANGAVAGIVTTLCTQPFDTIKTRSQSATGEGVVHATKGIWEDGGVRAFWRGTTMRLGRTVMAGGILFTAYEQVVRVVRPVLSPIIEE